MPKFPDPLAEANPKAFLDAHKGTRFSKGTVTEFIEPHGRVKQAERLTQGDFVIDEHGYAWMVHLGPPHRLSLFENKTLVMARYVKLVELDHVSLKPDRIEVHERPYYLDFRFKQQVMTYTKEVIERFVHLAE